jgi:hypothetical protein
MTPELAYALSRYTGESRSIVARLAMGDPKARQLIEESATQWVNASQEGGEFSRLSKMYDELDELKSRRTDEGYDIVPDTQTRDIAIFNKDTEIALLENKIAEGVNALPSELPYLDALNIRQLEIQRLSKFVDEVEDVAGANARMAAMNER